MAENQITNTLENPTQTLEDCLQKASTALSNLQNPDGYWWFTLEANDTINSEMIYLIYYMGLETDPAYQSMAQGLAKQILKSQNSDGSWSISYGSPGDISATVECYLALKMIGTDTETEPLKKAREFVLKCGGMTECRIFTRVHLAMFGIIPWSFCPSMPVSLILFPNCQPINIYEFSSWARATIVPLLIIMNQKKIRDLGSTFLDELYPSLDYTTKTWNHSSSSESSILWAYKPKPWNSLENFFLQSDKVLKWLEKIHINPFEQRGLKECEIWIREHLARTEDIYPAMAYAAMALYVLGFDPQSDPTIIKALKGLVNFQIKTPADSVFLPATPDSQLKDDKTEPVSVYQQCCVSPVWDTPWSSMALLEAGQKDNSNIKKAAQWLVSKQILDTYGDWVIKNRSGRPGGWSFEFQNDYFPDVDDSIEVLLLLQALELDDSATKIAQKAGLDWVLSMQCKNGGWAAFDVDNTKNWVNKIPFSDHAACQDPPTPDITGRCLELLAAYGYTKSSIIVQKAVRYLESTQETDGSWEGRWGVAYIYGTWCALQGLAAIGYERESRIFKKAVNWLKSIQNIDGGFGESVTSYDRKIYTPLGQSVATQTSWALMGLIAGGGEKASIDKAASYLIQTQDSLGLWDEKHHTGTGFPGHFYIRYHGYRYYFPLLALAKYQQSLTRDGK